MSHSRSRSAKLRTIFNADRDRQLSAKIARLCVLYEDLRVEIFGIAENSIPTLDILDPEKDNWDNPERTGRYRRYYFVRRSMLTLKEFATALLLINADPDLQLNVAEQLSGGRDTWDSAVVFFKQKKTLLSAIRNDIGGHFGHSAALNALDNIRADAISSIELVDDKDFRLHFAGEIAASALPPHLQNKDIAHYETLLTECIAPAYRHATKCVQLLILEYLWPAFGR